MYNSSFKKKTLLTTVNLLLKQYSLLHTYIEVISKILEKEKEKKSKVGKWLQGVSLKLKTELTENTVEAFFLLILWFQFYSVSKRLLLFTKSRTSTLLILAVCRTSVEYQPSIWPRSPCVLRSSSGWSTRLVFGRS